MKLNYFKDFGEVDDYFKDVLINVKDAQRDTLRAIGIHLRKKIRAAHGVDGPGWAKNYSSPNSPLKDSGGLRRAVSFITTHDNVEVYSKDEQLALIHEYGITYKMSEKQRRFLFAKFKGTKTKGRPRSHWGSGMVRIPARPIWRRIISLEEDNIFGIAENYHKTIFK